jgi:hypothetical protein
MDVISAKFGQFPRLPGSPPILTYVDTEGVGLSSRKSWNQPGGQICEFGGAVIVHVFPEQENAGNRILCPILLPWVDVSAPSKDAYILAVLLEVTITVTDWP